MVKHVNYYIYNGREEGHLYSRFLKNISIQILWITEGENLRKALACDVFKSAYKLEHAACDIFISKKKNLK